MKNPRNNSAVSPVIATILMVSITVVLAGILATWVFDLMGTNKTTTPFLSAEVKDTEDSYLIVITDVQGKITLSDVEIFIEGPGGVNKRVFNVVNDDNTSHTLDQEGIYGNRFLLPASGAAVAVGFEDATPADGRLNQDDAIYLKKTTPTDPFGVDAQDRIRLVVSSSKTVIYDEPMQEG